jgi:hypothetical protein
MVRRILLVAVVLCIVAANRPETQVSKAKIEKSPLDEMNDISGYYTCKGKEVSGKSYSGITIIRRKSDLYLVQWMLSGGSTFTGVGIRQGNTLATSWAMVADKGTLVRGVNMYKIETGPRLTGRWATIPGPGVVQTETLTFLKNLDEEE